jgi:hypothetical protein
MAPCVAMDEQAAATLRRARSHQDLPDEQPEYSGRKALIMEPSRDSANHLAQKDGGLPTTLAAGAAPGGSGVSVFEHDSRAPCISPPPPGSTRYVFNRPRPCASSVDWRVGRFGTSHQRGRCRSVRWDGLCRRRRRHIDSVLVAIEPAQLGLAAAESRPSKCNQAGACGSGCSILPAS